MLEVISPVTRSPEPQSHLLIVPSHLIAPSWGQKSMEDISDHMTVITNPTGSILLQTVFA